MQTIRGTKDILSEEIKNWQDLYLKALELLSAYNYSEIRTPIIESTELFIKGVGSDTDIINKEMYSFADRGQRSITLRPEGTACIARAYISNRLYIENTIQKLWYMGPMFRYERPQNGRQRQFHQLGVECIGSNNPLADAEVINIANNILKEFKCPKYTIEINSIGTQIERVKYKEAFIDYIQKYKSELDLDSQRRLINNPLRIFDSKNLKTQEILEESPRISHYLEQESLKNFNLVCEYLNILKIPFKINTKLFRGLDYYSHTAFEITNTELGKQNTICGGGRYNNLIQQLGGPNVSGVGWAIGIERLFLLINKSQKIQEEKFYIITQSIDAQKKACHLIQLLEKHNIKFYLDLTDNSFQKQIKKAIQMHFLGCLILGLNEIKAGSITVKWLKKNWQDTIPYNNLISYINKNKENTQ